jgi:hypothetical protein
LQRCGSLHEAVSSSAALSETRDGALAARVDAAVGQLQEELRATGSTLADGVMAAKEDAVARMGQAVDEASERTRAAVVSDLVPSLALLADELHAVSMKAETVRADVAQVAEAVPALQEQQAATRAAVANAAAATEERVGGVASSLSDVSRTVDAVEQQVAEVLQLLRRSPRRSVSGRMSPPPVVPAAEEEALEEESQESAGQVYPLSHDALGANASLDASARAASVVGYYAVPAGSAARGAAETTYLAGSARPHGTRAPAAGARAALSPGAAGESSRSAPSASATGVEAADAREAGAGFRGTVPLPRLGGSTPTARRPDGEHGEMGRSASLRSASFVSAQPDARAEAASTGAAGADAAASGALRTSGGVLSGMDLQEAHTAAADAAGSTGPWPLQELDAAELSAGEVVLAEDYSFGELVELLPITQGLPTHGLGATVGAAGAAGTHPAQGLTEQGRRMHMHMGASDGYGPAYTYAAQ